MADPAKPTMGRLMAVKKHLEAGEHGQPTSASEIQAFWKACSEADKAAFARSAAEALGVDLTDVSPAAAAA
jgi:hypothetical protein